MKRKGDWIMPSEGNREAARGEPAWWIAVIFEADARAKDDDDKSSGWRAANITRADDPLLKLLVPASAKSPGFIRIKRDFNGIACAIHRQDFREWLDERKRADAEERLRGRHDGT